MSFDQSTFIMSFVPSNLSAPMLLGCPGSSRIAYAFPIFIAVGVLFSMRCFTLFSMKCTGQGYTALGMFEHRAQLHTWGRTRYLGVGATRVYQGPSMGACQGMLACWQGHGLGPH